MLVCSSEANLSLRELNVALGSFFCRQKARKRCSALATSICGKATSSERHTWSATNVRYPPLADNPLMLSRLPFLLCGFKGVVDVGLMSA